MSGFERRQVNDELAETLALFDLCLQALLVQGVVPDNVVTTNDGGYVITSSGGFVELTTP